MTESQYKALCESCDRLLLAPDSSLTRIAIPWLHVIREHPFFLANYNNIFNANTFYNHYFTKIRNRLRNLYIFLRLLLKASQKKEQMWYGSEPLFAKIDYLFISHLLNTSHIGKSEDFYFGKMPNELADMGYKVMIALINHSGEPGELLASKWGSESVPRVVFSESVGFSEELFIHRMMKKESKKIKRLALNEKNGLYFKVFERASDEALSIDTQNVLRLGKQISELVARFNPGTIIITHEGHAWERITFAAARSVQPSIRCVGYQHAALFRLQHAIRRNLQQAYNPDHILTAGVIGKTQLESSPGIKGIQVSVLGSNRVYIGKDNKENFHSLSATDYHPQNQSCLVLPEGDVGECNLLFEFSLSCAQLCQNINFIWRLHPLVSFEFLISQNYNFRNLPKNIELSKNTLEEDIFRSRWALYRGTTAIIMAVQAGLVPIYLQVPDEMTIDPLYEIENVKIKVRSPRDFKNEIAYQSNIIKSKIEINEDYIRDYCKNFYSFYEITELSKLIDKSKK